jgi:hypothetical protein
MIFIDYKQKVLPCETKESQTKAFGMRGKSLFGMVVMFQLPRSFTGEIPDGIDIEGDFAISYVRACADDSDRDFCHSVQCFEIACKFVKQQYPWIQEAMLYSDGAGNFRSLSFEFLMAERIAQVGIKVVCHLLPEAGDGKDRVDRDFAGVNKLFWSYLKQPGSSMQNAVEMVKALQYGRKESGSGVTNCALKIDRSMKPNGVDTAGFTKLVNKSRDNMYYTEFEYCRKNDGGGLELSGARFFSYYKMGTLSVFDCNAKSELVPWKLLEGTICAHHIWRQLGCDTTRTESKDGTQCNTQENKERSPRTEKISSKKCEATKD